MGLFDAIIQPALERSKKNLEGDTHAMLGNAILSELQRRGEVTAENQETVARAILDELHKKNTRK